MRSKFAECRVAGVDATHRGIGNGLKKKVPAIRYMKESLAPSQKDENCNWGVVKYHAMDLSPFGFPKRRDTAVVLGAGARRGADFVRSHSRCKPPLDVDFFNILRSSGLHDDPDVR